MSMRSKASRRRSPSARRTPRGIRALPWQLPPSLYDFLRLLWARAGRTYCPNDGILVERDSVDHVAAKMLAQPESSRWYALFPIPPEPTTDLLRDRLFDLRKKGFTRLFQAGRVFEFSTPESLLDIDFSQAGIRAGGSPGHLARHAPASGRYRRNLLSRSRRSDLREGGRGAGRRGTAPLQRKVPVQDLRQGIRRARAQRCSASTVPSAPASAARASATPSITTWIW